MNEALAAGVVMTSPINGARSAAPYLPIPGIRPSQSAGRLHGLEESCLGGTQPERPAKARIASNEIKRGFLKLDILDFDTKLSPLCNCPFEQADAAELGHGWIGAARGP